MKKRCRPSRGCYSVCVTRDVILAIIWLRLVGLLRPVDCIRRPLLCDAMFHVSGAKVSSILQFAHEEISGAGWLSLRKTSSGRIRATGVERGRQICGPDTTCSAEEARRRLGHYDASRRHPGHLHTQNAGPWPLRRHAKSVRQPACVGDVAHRPEESRLPVLRKDAPLGAAPEHFDRATDVFALRGSRQSNAPEFASDGLR